MNKSATQTPSNPPSGTRSSSSHKPGVVKDGESRHAPFDPEHYKPASPDPTPAQRSKHKA